MDKAAGITIVYTLDYLIQALHEAGYELEVRKLFIDAGASPEEFNNWMFKGLRPPTSVTLFVRQNFLLA